KKDVRLADQLAGDRQALVPSAREGPRGLARICEPQPSEHQSRPAALLELLQRLARQCLDQDHLGRKIRREDRILRHIARANSLAHRPGPGVWILDPGEDLEESRFAGTV